MRLEKTADGTRTRMNNPYLMSKGVFNLADKNVVDSNAQILKLVFSKDPHDSNYMPATRDLSAYKKKIIINYLENIINKG